VDAAMLGATEIVGQGANNVRRNNYQLTITGPDGKVSTQTFAYISDPTGIQSYYFTPDQVGNYTLKFDYPQQTYVWNSTNTPGLSAANSAYYGDVFTPSSSTLTITVQDTPIDSPITPSLPTAYWTYPIYGENYNWYTIASNWLSMPFVTGTNPSYGIPGAYQPDGSAPNSPHIMWSRPIQYGGVVGGNKTGVPGESFYQGGSYNIRFNNPIIMQGTLFFQLPYGNAGTGGNYVAWDLKTGQQLWSINTTQPNGLNLVPSFGYLPTMDQPNQHGILPNGLLIATYSIGGTFIPGFGTFGGTPAWAGYDPMTGVLTTMNVTNVPGGSNVAGPSGEYLKFVLTNLGTTANPKWYLAEWNSSKVFGYYAGVGVSYWYSGTLNANVPITPAIPTTTPPTGQAWNWNGTGWQTVASALATSTLPSYDWNVSINLGPGSWSIGSSPATAFGSGGYPLISLGNMAIMQQGTFGGHVSDFTATVTTDPANLTAISLNLPTLGNTLWKQTYPPAPGNNTRTIVAWDPTNGVFVFEDKESLTHYGYSLSSGQQLWGPVSVPRGISTDWNFLSLYQDMIAYGLDYWYGYTGFIYAFNTTTGELSWTFGNGGEGNSTYSGFGTPYGYDPIFVSAIAEGKLYTTSSEHSPNSPLYQGMKLRCINATTGKEIWSISDFGNQMYGGITAIASGYLVTDNTYDQQLYVYGKGPSQLTVSAPQTSIEQGRSLVISGSVSDISAGTKQPEQAADFPNGVPAVSDASMSSWMEYVYMQKPMPTDTTGVTVTLSVIDSNGNFRQIGSSTSDTSGSFSYQWQPDIPGKYTVIADFAGSESYYPSHAETSFAVDPAAPTPSPYPVAASPPTEMYFTASTIAIIIAIVIVGAAIVLLQRRRP
ncbi:MAG TPA: PQQ-binding-like beta-propeller repeat protein, partial [Candidatus Binatia bacterium]|nr:PQQ-binding-like beta-propeller repeat protein [Candidatus Binatia bacterium]